MPPASSLFLLLLVLLLAPPLTSSSPLHLSTSFSTTSSSPPPPPPPSPPLTVVPGADALVRSNFAILKGLRVGVIANPTTILQSLEHLVDYMVSRPDLVNITAVFSPEHGFRGDDQAGSGDQGVTRDNQTGLLVYNTYGQSGANLSLILQQAGVDVLVFDIQDVGTRFYTYVWTMWDCLSAAAGAGIRHFVVLDRPNPINGVDVQGPVLEPAFSSFIGRLAIPMRHGLTVGELANLFYNVFLPDASRAAVQLRVVQMQGWKRSMYFEDTGLVWVPPSPNMPTPTTALVYPGLGCIEGTNLSEGRGTTRPFEFFGAPYLNWTYAETLRAGLPACKGAAFREAYFTPTFEKWMGNVTCGAQLYITDRSTFDPIATGLQVILTAKQQAPTQFEWLGNSFDLHMGTNSTRLAMEAGVSIPEIVLSWGPQLQQFSKIRLQYLLY